MVVDGRPQSGPDGKAGIERLGKRDRLGALAVASPIRGNAFRSVASRSRNTGAARTAATLTMGKDMIGNLVRSRV
ncbi:hypothetical protein CS8_091970 [Cupriavidus sp. 8B]